MSAVATFRRLHEEGCFVLPNPWDVGTAVFLHRAGFPALASSSAGLAFAMGKRDVVGAVSLEDTLAHLRELAGATPLPVNADLQDGYGQGPEEVAESVRRCIATGVAGLSIEDATPAPDVPLYARAEAVERVGAARRAIDASGVPVVLTARCEAWLVGDETPKHTAIDRLVAFAAEGADCLYAPGISDLATVREVVRAVEPLPVNVLAGRPGFTVAGLRDVGVRRISVGSALSRVAWGALIRSARSILETGSFEGLGEAASFAELDALFGASEAD